MQYYITAAFLLLFALVFFFVYRNNKAKYESIMRASLVKAGEIERLLQDISRETSQANWSEYVKVGGTIQCDRPLISKFKREPCVYYCSVVTRKYEETVTRTDNEGNTTTEVNQRSEELSRNTNSTPFYLVDETGAILVDPEGADDIDTIQVLDEYRPEGTDPQSSRYYPRSGGYSSGSSGGYGSRGYGGEGYGSSSSGGYSSGGGYYASGDRNFEDRMDSRTLGYEYTEKILPVGRRAFVVGTAKCVSGRAIIEKPVDAKKKYIVSLKSEAQLTADAARWKDLSLYLMLACGSGSVLLVLFRIWGILK